jgi:phage terminase large subunit
MTYKIIEASQDSAIGYQPFGAAADLWLCKASEVIISGPAETGKTLAALHKIDALAWKYPNLHGLIIRKTRVSLDASALKTYQNKVLSDDSPVTPYGGNKPEWFDYPNNSRLVVGGLDRAGKVLSAEYDLIYVNQAEELTLDDWETLTTRATGRAGNMPYAQVTTRATGRAGNMPYAQVIGDCNPDRRLHWILERAREKKLKFLESRHEDNPTLYDQATGELTQQGKITMATLDNLSGVRYQRLRLGRWVSAEGQIYENYDPAIHLIDRFDLPDDWRRIRVIDFGLVHPFVCHWYAIDGDGRMYLYREIYMTGRTVATHAKQIKQLSEGEQIETTICDHDAEDRLTLKENGIPNIPARKDVLQGIGKVQDRLKKQADGKPRFFILRDSLIEIDQSLKMQHLAYSTDQEFDSYIWADNTRKEQPIKENDHGMDTVRYGVMFLDGPAATLQYQDANPFYS